MIPTLEIKEFIKGWEGCRLKPYKDAVGKWTCGWGHLLREGEEPREWSQHYADNVFVWDLNEKALIVKDCLNVPVSQQQFDTLCSLAFNLKPVAFANSTFIKRINSLMFGLVPKEILRWNKGTLPSGQMVEIEGLSRRRQAECDIWTHGDYSGRP